MNLNVLTQEYNLVDLLDSSLYDIALSYRRTKSEDSEPFAQASHESSIKVTQKKRSVHRKSFGAMWPNKCQGNYATNTGNTGLELLKKLERASLHKEQVKSARWLPPNQTKEKRIPSPGSQKFFDHEHDRGVGDHAC